MSPTPPASSSSSTGTISEYWRDDCPVVRRTMGRLSSDSTDRMTRRRVEKMKKSMNDDEPVPSTSTILPIRRKPRRPTTKRQVEQDIPTITIPADDPFTTATPDEVLSLLWSFIEELSDIFQTATDTGSVPAPTSADSLPQPSSEPDAPPPPCLSMPPTPPDQPGSTASDSLTSPGSGAVTLSKPIPSNALSSSPSSSPSLSLIPPTSSSTKQIPVSSSATNSGSSSASPSSTPMGSVHPISAISKGQIAGGVVGGTLFVLVFLILAIFFIVRNRRRRNRQPEWGYPLPTTPHYNKRINASQERVMSFPQYLEGGAYSHLWDAVDPPSRTPFNDSPYDRVQDMVEQPKTPYLLQTSPFGRNAIIPLDDPAPLPTPTPKSRPVLSPIITVPLPIAPKHSPPLPPQPPRDHRESQSSSSSSSSGHGGGGGVITTTTRWSHVPPMTPIPETRIPEKDPFHADDSRSIATQHRKRLASSDTLRYSGDDDSRFKSLAPIMPRKKKRTSKRPSSTLQVVNVAPGLSRQDSDASEWSKSSFAASSRRY